MAIPFWLTKLLIRTRLAISRTIGRLEIRHHGRRDSAREADDTGENGRVTSQSDSIDSPPRLSRYQHPQATFKYSRIAIQKAAKFPG